MPENKAARLHVFFSHLLRIKSDRMPGGERRTDPRLLVGYGAGKVVGRHELLEQHKGGVFILKNIGNTAASS
jgi:hypothetical protein